MTGKTKKIMTVLVTGVLCAALAVGIGLRFSGMPDEPHTTVAIEQPQKNDTNVNVQNPTREEEKNISVNLTPTQSDPGAGANSSGTQQTIQADPVKPETPEPPKAPENITQLPEDHTADDVPEEERKTEDEDPPEYDGPPTVTPEYTEPVPGSENSAGEVYVPGFGYVENGGENDGGTLNDMYENGNKIGVMGGE